MSAIRSRDTKPEMLVRSIVHRLGFRFRLHETKLPGKPDLVLSRHHKIILVHGCFWHMHSCKRGAVTPKTRFDYWQNKLERNVQRDMANLAIYRKAGWKVMIIWECETHDPTTIRLSLIRFLTDDANYERLETRPNDQSQIHR